MIGTLINVAAVIVGSVIGLIFNSAIPKRFINIAFTGIGIFTLTLGISMAINMNEPMLIVFSIIVGSILGEALDLEKRLNGFSEKLKSKLKLSGDTFSDGLITAFLLFCMGSMTILGAIEEGVQGTYELFLTKSLMDGFAAVALASTLGIGVMFSVVPLFIYQGGLTLVASSISQFVTGANDPIIVELSATGGLLLIALGLNILEIKKIKVLNMLPSLLFIIVFVVIKQMI